MNPSGDGAKLRIALLQHGGMGGVIGKTGLSLLRYRGSEIVAVIDRDTTGGDAGAVSGIPEGRGCPIVSDMRGALAFSPNVLAIGIAPLGGRLPDAWIEEIALAVRSGVSVWNGLHRPLMDYPTIAQAIRTPSQVWDMRKEPPDIPVGKVAARSLSCRRVLFVGTDMAIGKMTAALELHRAAKNHRLRSKFIATGQTGMMIAGDGIPLDAVRIDFAAAAVEQEVMRHGGSNDVLWIEGQGSLLNPVSTATLSLMRGSQPTHLILVHKAGMTHLANFPSVPVPPLAAVVKLNEDVTAAAGALQPARVAGIALNTWGLSDAAAAAACEKTALETHLPCVDAVRHGGGRLLRAVLGE